MGLKELQNIREHRNDPKPKKFKAIAKKSQKKIKQEAEAKETQLLDKEFYLEHWRACGHTCEQCGCKLGKEPLTLFFHHALPKRNYPQFRHTHENIIVVCRDCHAQCETDLDKTPIIKRRTQEIEKLLLHDN